jgi:PAS domain S-box-containing protein
LSEKSGDVISVLDKHGVIQYESLPSKHVFGQPPHELLGHNFLEYVHPEHKTAIKKCFTAVSKVKDKSVIAKCRYMHGNGSWIWAELSIKNLLSDQAVQGILIHKKDITKSHKTEELLKSSETKFKSLFTQSLEAIYLVDPLTRIVIDANQSFLDHTGYKEEDYGKIALEDFVDASISSINSYINKVLAGTHVENVERIWKRKSGERITVLVSGSKIKLGHNEIVVASARDISAQKKTELELRKINQEMDTFVYKASHDLRGPLTTCLGLVNMSHDEVRDEKAIWYLSMINDVLGKLDGILTDLTQITSIRQGNVQFVSVSLRKLMKEVVSEFNGHPDAKDLVFDTNIKAGNMISSDPAILRMVFRNLIGNAIKYKNTNRRKAKLQISTSEVKGATEVTFKDNGIGIDEHLLNLVFEMFFRGTTESEGSGLGLYMVRTGLEKINSSISVASKLGRGCKFIISIPNPPS